MKKISIILSAALLAATFALAGCSNVSELNGSEWDTYKAGASGKSLADAKKAEEAEAAAEAEKVSITYTGAGFADFKDVKNHKSSITSTWKNEFTWDLNATAGTAATFTVRLHSCVNFVLNHFFFFFSNVHIFTRIKMTNISI